MNDKKHEIDFEERDGQQHWTCGCITWREPYKGDNKSLQGTTAFVIESCGNEVCPVLVSVQECCNETDKPIEHHKKEEWMKK